MSDFWQAPGNGKGFDSSLGNNSKMNNRTIGVLSYIKEKSIETGFVSQVEFKNEIKAYLQQNFDENPNESLGTHFYRPALFYGFLHINKNNNLSLSIEGNLFLTSYKNREYSECKKLVINQLDNTTYPNKATEKIKTLKLFPFRILFKLLLDKQTLKSSFISNTLVHIKQHNDLISYETTKNLNNIASYSEKSSKYLKFNTWIINSLVDLNILMLVEKSISIHPSVIEHIKALYHNTDFSDMFFSTTSCIINDKIAEKRVKRDANLIYKAKQRDKYICSINSKHKTFISKGSNYVEGHHIIPMFQQKNFNFILDDLNNISSLCPNCHREIHSADDKTEILRNLYNLNTKYMTANNIQLHDLYKMYSCS